jgi:hypothetical protein
MTVNPDFIAPCGLYCGVCAIYIAHRDDNPKFKQRLLSLYQGEIAGKGRLPNSEKLSLIAGHSVLAGGGHRKMDSGRRSPVCLPGMRQQTLPRRRQMQPV